MESEDLKNLATEIVNINASQTTSIVASALMCIALVAGAIVSGKNAYTGISARLGE